MITIKKISSIFLFLCSLSSLTVFALPTQNLLRNSNDPMAGNSQAPVTIVEFFDYQCSHCVSMGPVIANILNTNPNVRVVFKEFPIRGEMSELAARAALAANRQGKYLSLSHALLANNQPLSADVIFDIAKKQGLNVDKLRRDMQSKAISTQLKANYQSASELQLPGTPAFFIGKTYARDTKDLQFFPGEMTQSELQEAIDKAQK
jgi:protein-disulfide isomerase